MLSSGLIPNNWRILLNVGAAAGRHHTLGIIYQVPGIAEAGLTAVAAVGVADGYIASGLTRTAASFWR